MRDLKTIALFIVGFVIGWYLPIKILYGVIGFGMIYILVYILWTAPRE